MGQSDHQMHRDRLNELRGLASALFTVHFHAEQGHRPRRVLNATNSASAEALRLLEEKVELSAQDGADAELVAIRRRFLALARRKSTNSRLATRVPAALRGAHFSSFAEAAQRLLNSTPMPSAAWQPLDFYPHALVRNAASPIGDNRTLGDGIIVINFTDKNIEQSILHVARAVDPRSWVHTGFFADVYLAKCTPSGQPCFDDKIGYPIPLENDEPPLGGTWPSKRSDGLRGLLFENFDLNTIRGKPLASFRNVLGIRRFDVDARSVEMRFELYESLSSSLRGVRRDGGMDINHGGVTAKALTGDDFAQLMNPDCGSLKKLQLLASDDAENGRASEQARKLRRRVNATLMSLFPEHARAPESNRRDLLGDLNDELFERCVMIRSTKTVRFTDLTPFGESFVDLGEILNYSSPFVLKPFFEQLLILGAAALPTPSEPEVVLRSNGPLPGSAARTASAPSGDAMPKETTNAKRDFPRKRVSRTKHSVRSGTD